MANKKSWDKMDLAELEQASNALDEQRMAIATEMRELRKVIDGKLAEQSVTDKLARFSDAERAALAQMIDGAGGIESLANVEGLDGSATLG